MTWYDVQGACGWPAEDWVTWLITAPNQVNNSSRPYSTVGSGYYSPPGAT